MIDLRTYYRELSEREGMPPANLVSAWDPGGKRVIRRALKQAFGRCDFQCSPMGTAAGITNRSMLGHRVARFFEQTMGRHLHGFKIIDCKGCGYPDKQLLWLNRNRSYALEIKAAHSFSSSNGLRVTMSCSSGKLRKCFRPPIRHLLATICYRQAAGKLWVDMLRLDFLEPWTSVQVRLEASVTQRLLCRGGHTCVCFSA